jgi:hypothetical protein
VGRLYRSGIVDARAVVRGASVRVRKLYGPRRSPEWSLLGNSVVHDSYAMLMCRTNGHGCSSYVVVHERETETGRADEITRIRGRERRGEGRRLAREGEGGKDFAAAPGRADPPERGSQGLHVPLGDPAMDVRIGGFIGT